MEPRIESSKREQAMSPFHIALLEVVSVNDGKYSWYQLDQALSQRGFAGDLPSRLMPALRDLEQGSFVTTAAGHHPAQPLYSITDKGIRELQAHQDGTRDKPPRR